jgi:CheY-like chemotaxis protein
MSYNAIGAPFPEASDRRGNGELGAGRDRVRHSVLVLDDHPAVRWGLVQLLEDQHDLTVAGVATNAEAAVEQAEQREVDVAVVDYHLGGRNGLWATRKLKALARPTAVVVFSAFANGKLRCRRSRCAAEQGEPRRRGLLRDPGGRARPPAPSARAAAAGRGPQGPP